MLVEKEKNTTPAELKTDWQKIQNFNGIVKASAITRAIQKYGFDISEKSEQQIDAMCQVATSENKAPKEKVAKKVTVAVETVKVTTLQVGDMYRYKTSETSYEVKEVLKDEKGEISEIKVEADNGKKWSLKAKRDITADVVKI